MRSAGALLLLAMTAASGDDFRIAAQQIAAPGIPGPLCVYGKDARVLFAGGAGKACSPR